MLWTPRQRSALTFLTAGLLAYLLVRYAVNRRYVSDPQAEEGARATQLPGRVDPNTADAATLSAIPVMGPAMAERIVAEREAFLAANPGKTAYGKLEDLLRVKGIGPATLGNLEPHLIFPAEDRPATQP
ncbi:MAG: helix-hairpin-helix domain-containing protein [Planctomycetota bacterium]|nr:helix-hairpin-helix domain-containing protein [Planctomycetota bacterium]